MRDHPIPPVTEPLQYRAIGVVRGIYKPEKPNILTRGYLIDAQGNEIEAVVLGRVLGLMKRYLAIEKAHLWVVYPRNKDSNQLHLQIGGIWEPSTLDLNKEKKDQGGSSIDNLKEGDDYFSIRGELVYTKPELNEVVVKIRQKSRSNNNKPLPFKIKLKGDISLDHVRNFVSLEARRNGQMLCLEKYEIIQEMPTRGGKKAGKRVINN